MASVQDDSRARLPLTQTDSGTGRLGVASVIADLMADSQVFRVAVTTLTQRLDMLQRGSGWRHMFTTNPTRHLAMKLPCHGFVDLVADQG